MVADHDLCWRLRGVPAEWDTDDVIDFLRTNILGHGSNPAATVKSLALDPTCIRPMKTATLNFEETPKKLQGQHRYRVQNDEMDIELDNGFFGFTPLHRVPDESCDIDIFAVCGFRGHAFGSFKSKGCGEMWLRDFLPKDLERARVFVYGYDTISSSSQTIIEIERAFKENFKALRASSKQRPWILIGHSFGGLVAKEVITSLAESESQEEVEIFGCLRAALFFGVPHKGILTEIFAQTSPEESAARRLPQFTDETSRDLIEIIDKLRPAYLRQLHTRFIKAVHKLKSFKSFNFYETKASPTMKFWMQKFEMWWKKEDSTSGDRLLVSPDSATQGFLDDDNPMHRVFPVNESHSDMVKFGTANDDAYKTVIRCLKKIRAGACHLKEIKTDACSLTEVEKACLRSLAFPSMTWREEEDRIKAHKGTCQWLKDHQNCEKWFNTYQSLLWILGYPGSGKSTLMRSEVQRLSEKGEIVAKFFVSNQGDRFPGAKLPLGMYSSLLYQILPLFPDHLRKLASTFRDRQELRGEWARAWGWGETYLRDFLFEVLESTCSNQDRPIFLFIDAVDELGYEPAQRIVTSFIDFLRKPDRPELNLSICLSCRYSPALRDGGLAISVDSENANDIKTFIEDHPTVIKLGSKGEMLQKLILERANGSFRWVFTVLKKVTELRRQRESFATILTQVKEFPRGVESLREKTRAMEDWGNEEEEESAQTNNEAPPTNYQAPPTNYQELPTNSQTPRTNYQAPPTNDQAPPTNYQAPPTNYQTPPINDQIPRTNYQASPTNYQVPLTNYQALPTNYQIPPTIQMPTNYQTPPTIYQTPPTIQIPTNYQTPPTNNQTPPTIQIPTNYQTPPTIYQTPPTNNQTPPTIQIPTNYQTPPTIYQIPPTNYQTPPPTNYQTPPPANYQTPPPANYQTPPPADCQKPPTNYQESATNYYEAPPTNDYEAPPKYSEAPPTNFGGTPVKLCIRSGTYGQYAIYQP